jgi:hypothetical protein
VIGQRVPDETASHQRQGHAARDDPPTPPARPSHDRPKGIGPWCALITDTEEIVDRDVIRFHTH